MKKFGIFLLTIVLTIGIAFWAINTGGIKTSLPQLLKGLFVSYDENVAIIYELRFPRIIVALLGGAIMAMSGVLMQAVLKNPLADPGIIGITSGAGLAAAVIPVCFPAIAMLTPIFSFAGGMIAFILVYLLAWNGSASPIRLILVGIAIDAVFSSLMEIVSAVTNGNILNANISLKTWDDVKMLGIYFVITIILAILVSNQCNLLALSDQTLHSLGVNVNSIRILVSLIAVLMASIFTAVVGSVSFLGLIVPHIARLLVGSNHKILIPYSAILGASIFLLADTIGRTIAYPYEISSAIIMAVIGGPMFIILLRRSQRVYG